MQEQQSNTGMLDDNDGVASEVDQELKKDVVAEETQDKETEETQVGTPEEDTTVTEGEESEEQDTSQEDDDEITKAFKAKGLDKHYSDVEDFINRSSGYITGLEQDRAALLKAVQAASTRDVHKETRSEITAEQFNTAFDADPMGALRKAGFVTKDEAVRIGKDEASRLVKGELSNDRYTRFITDHSDYEAMMPKMKEISRSHPFLQKLSDDELQVTLYNMAKGQFAGSGSSRVEDTSAGDPAKRNNAKTSGGTGARKSTKEPSVEQIEAMSPEQLRAIIPTAPGG